MTTIVSFIEKISLVAFPRITAMRLVLLAVFVFATGNAVTGRGAFFDEAIYQTAGRVLVFRGEDWNFVTWFVGSPFGYPILVGLVDRLGFASIEAARMVNVPFLIFSTWLVNKIAQQSGRSEKEAVYSALWFGVAGPVIFTGSFATYDMPALMFTLTAISLVLRGTRNQRIYPLPLLAAGLALSFAIFFKYVVIAITPAFALIIFMRLNPQKRSWVPQLFHWKYRICLVALAGIILLIPVAVILGVYVAKFSWQLALVFRYSGGHTTSYGATSGSIVWQVMVFLATSWLMARYGLFRLKRCDRGEYLVGVAFLLGSFIMPLYHILRVDPLALFKQICWSYAFLSPLVGPSLGSMSKKWFRVTLLGLVLISGYHLHTLRGFYPDTRPVVEYLREVVTPEDEPILVDNAWPTRYALADTFRGEEWKVVDQWWLHNQLADSQLWREHIRDGTFSRIVVEKGGAFSGAGSVMDDSVVRTIEESANYRLEREFSSWVTWGNSILPPPFQGDLRAYSQVRTQIYVRIYRGDR